MLFRLYLTFLSYYMRSTGGAFSPRSNHMLAEEAEVK